VQSHALDHPALQAGHGYIVRKRKAAPGLNLKSPNRVGAGEAGIQIFAVHGQPNTVGRAVIDIGAEDFRARCEGADVNPDNISGRGVGGVDALITRAVQQAEAVRAEKTAPNTTPAGYHLLHQCECATGPDAIERGPVAEAHIVVRNDVMWRSRARGQAARAAHPNHRPDENPYSSRRHLTRHLHEAP